MSFSNIISEAEKNGGQASATLKETQPIQADIVIQETTSILSVPEYQSGPPRRIRALGTICLGLNEDDLLRELGRTNRNIRVSKEHEKHCVEQLRQARMAQLQRELGRYDIVPLQTPFDISVTPDFLPKSLVSTANYLSSLTGQDPLGTSIAMLGGVSVSTWGRVNIRLDADWSEPAVDMVVQISGSGTRKTALVSKLRTPFDQHSATANDGYELRANLARNEARLLKQVSDKRARQKVAEAIREGSPQSEVERIKTVVREAITFEQELLCDCASIYPPVQLLVDNATAFQLAVTLQKHGECQGCITAEGSMIKSRLARLAEAANLFLRGHTQESYVYENANQKIALEHPALPMVNMVQPVVASAFYGNDALNELGVTARFVPYFYSNCGDVFTDKSRGSLEPYTKKIQQMLGLFHTQDKNAKRYQVTVERAAQRRIHDFIQEIKYDIIPNMPESAEPCLRKAHGQAVRFAWDIHAWNHDHPHTIPIKAQEMEQAIELVRTNFEHIRYAYDPCGLVAYRNAQKIRVSLNKITDRWEQRKLLREGTDSSTLQRRTKINAERTNNALYLLNKHNYLEVYDDATPNLKIVLHPYFFG